MLGSSSEARRERRRRPARFDIRDNDRSRHRGNGGRRQFAGMRTMPQTGPTAKITAAEMRSLSQAKSGAARSGMTETRIRRGSMLRDAIAAARFRQRGRDATAAGLGRH
jgi:hypothetical protein